MKKSMLLLLIATAIGITGCNHHTPPSAVERGEENGIMEIDSTVNLMIYYPQFTHIDLVCENMPRRR